MLRHLRRVLVIVSACVLAACGGGTGSDSTPPAPPPATSPPPPPPPPVAVTIGPTGGTVAAGTVALEIPAGALAAPLSVTVTPQTAAAGDVITFAVSPARQVLAKPALLRHTGALPAGASFYWTVDGERRFVPTKREGNALTAVIRSLGAITSEAQAATTAHGAAAQARALSDGAGGSQGGVAVIDCDLKISALNSSIQKADWRGDFEAAQLLYDELSAVALQCQAQQIKQLEQQACDAFASAVLLAQVTAADSHRNLAAAIKPLLSSQAVVAAVGGSCDTSAANRLLTEKFDQFLTFVAADFSRPRFADATGARDLRSLFQYEAQCLELGLSICERFGKELYPVVLDRAREGAFRLCVQNNSALELAQLYNLVLDPASIAPGAKFLSLANYTYGELERDVHRCTTEPLVIRVFNDIPEETGRAEIPGGGTPGQQRMQADVQIGPGGALTLGGQLPVPVCPDNTLASADKLVARINGAIVAERPANGPLWSLSPPIDFLPSRDLPRVGLAPDAEQYTISLFREGPSCGALFSAATLLYRINVGAAARPERIAFARAMSPHLLIFTVEPNGLGLTQLTRSTPGAASHVDADPTWSPDRSKIAFTRNADLMTIRRDGTEEQLLLRSSNGVSIQRPSWSPDGSRIAFISGTKLLAVDVASKAVVQLVDRINVTDASWAPDSQRIAFASGGAIYVADLRNGAVTRVTTPPDGGSDNQPAWSPNGKLIAFGRALDINTARMFVHNLETGIASEVVTGETNAPTSPSWSTDSTQIVYRVSLMDSADNTVLGVVTLGSGQTRRITSAPARDRSPAWAQ